MTKLGKKESSFIDDPQRCEICETTLTLYPKDFAACPHCHRSVCRQCWGGVWANKAFTAENCAHIVENDGRNMEPVGEGRKKFNWDWPRIVFAVVLSALAAGIILFLFSLFA